MMLQTQRTFSDNVIHFYVDDEVTSFLQSKKSLKSIYDLMEIASGKAAVYPLVIPISSKDFSFDLMMIIKHEKATEQGQWEIYVAVKFVTQKTNLAKLFSYIELATNTEAKFLIQGIQQELKDYREQFNLQGKTFVEIDGDNKIVAFGHTQN
jgi:hypothetical protein